MENKAIQELEKFASKDELAERINEITLRYAEVSLSLEDPCDIHKDTAEDIYWMMQIRDFFRKL